MPIFYDTHAHLDNSEFASDFVQILQRAQAAGITKLISIGTDLESSSRAIQLAETHPCIYAAVGCHPNEATIAPADLQLKLQELAMHPKVVAIGETGLDYFRLPSAEGGTTDDDELFKRRQGEIFQQQLVVAAESGLNCIIHQRGECFDDTLANLEPHANQVRGVFHCFSGNAEALDRVLALGSIISFTGIVTFKNGQNVRAALAATPLDSFMLETDCPYLAPIPYRGQRCEPAYVKEIAATVAQVKHCSLDQLSRATCATAQQFFHKLGN